MSYQLWPKMLELPRLSLFQPVNEGGSMGLPQHKRGGTLEPADGLKREIETLRNRLSGLSEAGVRITEDLDLDTVLQEVVDAARSLTGARISGLTALDEAGGLTSFITSGMDRRRAPAVRRSAGGTGVLRPPEQPSRTAQRLADFSAYTTALGLPEIGPPLGPVQGLSGRAHPSQGATHRQPLSIGQGGRP